MKIIPKELRELSERILDKDDFLAIAIETDFSFAYVKDIKNQSRYNKEVEEKLMLACEKKLIEFTKSFHLIKESYENGME